MSKNRIGNTTPRTKRRISKLGPFTKDWTHTTTIHTQNRVIYARELFKLLKAKKPRKDNSVRLSYKMSR